ncbi:hypothetical protein A3860_06860 [Niastella vici]|uniref:DUF4369 domain-containing protein n=1 Tax=Niastella vici TaxID=1703345 RepID=A0A1V9FKR3_9BACT|nr:hypothetical protein [Niastella vici]OQP58938.1 hypothetical protein A3860_06860 [Niastella vici]
MKKQLSILLFVTSFSANIKAQDSTSLFFEQRKIILPNCKSSCRITLYDSLFFVTIIDIGKSKYFYIKQRIQDTLTIESGQLGLYNISNNSFLLREGIWALEGISEKVLFDNFGKLGILDEVKVQLKSEMYEGFEKRKKKTIRRASKKSY